MRIQKTPNSDIIARFPIEESRTGLNIQSEVLEVLVNVLEPEVGTDGRPRIDIENIKIKPTYESLNIYGGAVRDEEILFQGKISKFQAGFNSSFNPKWVVVTKSVFRYYRN